MFFLKRRACYVTASLDQAACHPEQREETVQPYDKARKQYRIVKAGDKSQRALFD
jgi:hypothetical protein